jgi:nitrite reductase/ring-hydroxylating ferredoxin subunit
MFASKAQHLRGSATIKSANSRHSFKVCAVSVNTGIKKTDLKDGKFVFESDTKGRILIQEFMGELYVINNKCPHLGLPLQGKTPLLSATCTKNGGVVCSVHGSEFDLKTGAALGEWCPKVPTLPVIGKPMAGEPKPAEVYPVSVDENSGEIVLEL